MPPIQEPQQAGPLIWEQSPRWIRVQLGGETVADAKAPVLAWEKGKVIPFYLFPPETVRLEMLSEDGSDGLKRYYDLPGAERGAWSYIDAGELSGHIAFDWDAMDGWREEDEELFGHARDPHKRIDVRRSSRHVVVSIDGDEVADTTRPLLLFETGLPTRYYIPREDVRMKLLEPSDRHTTCAYKGHASYFSVGPHKHIAWYYPEPAPELAVIKDLIAFFNERADIEVDGEREERPDTQWSVRAKAS